MAVQAMNGLTSQQYADLVLAIWRDLRDLMPEDELEAALDRILENLRAENHERR
jgi:hypothetical protein